MACFLRGRNQINGVLKERKGKIINKTHQKFNQEQNLKNSNDNSRILMAEL